MIVVIGAEMLGERQRVEIERAEDEAAIGVDPRHLGQIVFRIAHVGGVAFGPRHAAQLAGVEEVPAVIGALERFAVALLPAAQRRAAMGAAIVERADFSLAVAHDDERTQAQASGDEVVLARDFAFVRDIGPRAAEDVGHLGFEDRGIGIDQPVRAIFLHQMIPVVQRGAAEPGRLRSDFLQRRHVALLISFPSPLRGGVGVGVAPLKQASSSLRVVQCLRRRLYISSRPPPLPLPARGRGN